MHAGVPEISPTIPMAAAPCSVDRICTVIGFVDVRLFTDLPSDRLGGDYQSFTPLHLAQLAKENRQRPQIKKTALSRG